MTRRCTQRRGERTIACVFAALVAAGCSDRADDANDTAASQAQKEVTLADIRFAPELRIAFDSMTRTDNGLYIDDVRVGTGATAELGRTVTIEYSAWLPNGTLYERRPNDEGFSAAELVLGEGEPRGLHAGIAGMKTGGTRRIVVPPDLSYGLVGRPDGVPPNSALVFEVRVRAVR